MLRRAFLRTIVIGGVLAALVGQPTRSGAEDATGQAAEAELAAAELAVAEATRQRALWTTARDALQEARAALQKGDFRAAIQAARFAREQAELGIAQTRAPRFPSKG